MSGDAPAFTAEQVAVWLPRIRVPLALVQEREDSPVGVMPSEVEPTRPLRHLGTLPALYPEWLGDRSFRIEHGVRFAYVAGEMANGIATAEMVIAMGNAGMLGFFGSAGLSLDRTDRELRSISNALGPRSRPWGANLIHSPAEPGLEDRVVDLFFAHDVRRVSASAFMALTPAVVRYACAGLQEAPGGEVVRRRHLFAKVSRPEVARHFLSPPPPELLAQLVREGKLRASEAALAARVPIAEDVTVEADSGGHTDNRPLAVVFPTIAALRDELTRRYGYRKAPRLGAAGGLATPSSIASAFALGAAFVLTGTINQATRESGLSLAGRRLLAKAGIADVAMCPAGDMFELGVEVQVLRRGTMFAARAQRLYELYLAHDGLDDLRPADRDALERELFRKPIADVWSETQAYFAERDPEQITRAEADPKHRMALVFRWYLGHSSRWAIRGEPGRELDYQIWCGPAMGAFNAWAAGSFLEPIEARGVAIVALNLLESAAIVTRAHQLRCAGVALPLDAFDVRPRPLTRESPHA